MRNVWIGLKVAVLSSLVACSDPTRPLPSSLATTTSSASPSRDWASLPSPHSATTAAVIYGGNCIWSIAGDGGVESLCAASPPPAAWTPQPPLPVALSNFAGVGAVGNKIIVAGGLDASGSLTDAVYVYQPTTGWTLDQEPAPYLMACGGGAVIGGKLYVYALGMPANPPPVPAPNCGGFANVHQRLMVYDPASPPPRWKVLPLPNDFIRLWPGVAGLGSKLYVVGGVDASGINRFLTTVVFDTATGQWLPPSQLPSQWWKAPWRLGATSMNGKLFLTGGTADIPFNISNTVTVYDPATDTWDELRPMQASNTVAVAAANRLIALGDTPEMQVFGTGNLACDIFEPDNQLSQATLWQIVDLFNFLPFYLANVTQASLCSPDDADLFKLPGWPLGYNPGGIHVELTPPPNADYQLEAIDTTGTIVIARSANPGSGVKEFIYVDRNREVPPVYLRVRTQNGSFNRAARYQLHVVP